MAAGCRGSAVTTMVMNELGAAAERAGRARPELDPTICAVAEAFLGWDFTAHGNPRPAVLSFVSQWFGLPTTVMTPAVAVFETSDEKLVAERIVQGTGSSIVNSIRPKVGIVAQRLRRGKEYFYRVSVAHADSAVEIDPIPRRLDLGREVKLTGRLLGGVKNPRVLVSDAAGGLSEQAQEPGTEFQAGVRCGDRPGTILIEIRGEYEGSAGVVASFPIACGVQPPVSVAVAGEVWPSDTAGAEKRILEEVNAERAGVGLKPVAWDAAVAGVARAISEELAARAGAPGGMDVGQRLKNEGIASPLILQSAAAERTVEGAHERLIGSPTNRTNILNPDVTNFGVGVHETTDPGGRAMVYVTEVFIKELPPIDVSKARQDLREAVARKRGDARAPVVEPSPELGELAQRHAEALAAAGGTLSKEQTAEFTAALGKGFRSVVVVSGARQETLDLAEEPPVTSPGKLLGVGIAQGRHPVLGRSAVYAVIVIASPKR